MFPVVALDEATRGSVRAVSVRRCSLSSSGDTTTQGRVFWISVPRVGSRSTRKTGADRRPRHAAGGPLLPSRRAPSGPQCPTEAAHVFVERVREQLPDHVSQPAAIADVSDVHPGSPADHVDVALGVTHGMCSLRSRAGRRRAAGLAHGVLAHRKPRPLRRCEGSRPA